MIQRKRRMDGVVSQDTVQVYPMMKQKERKKGLNWVGVGKED